MKWFDRDIEVRYADTDAMGVVHHSVYPIYAELGRVHLCREVNAPYHEMEAAGYLLMVAEMSFRFKAPATFGEPLMVRTGISTLRKKLVVFEYEIRHRENQRLCATGNSKHIVTLGTKGLAMMPDEYVEKFSTALN